MLHEAACTRIAPSGAMKRADPWGKCGGFGGTERDRSDAQAAFAAGGFARFTYCGRKLRFS